MTENTKFILSFVLAFFFIGTLLFTAYKSDNSNGLIVGAPKEFIALPPNASLFSFIIGTGIKQTNTGTSTLFVYGSTTLQTYIDTPGAFRVLNAASSTIFAVDTLNASTTARGIFNAGTTTLSGLRVGDLIAASCDVKSTTAG